MKKLKLIFCIAVTSALVILCATLPKLTALVMDKEAEKTVVYEDLQPISLEAKQGTETFSMLEKLSLCANGQRVDIKPANATKTEAEIKTGVEAFLEQCESAGIFYGFQPSSATLSTKLIYDVADPSSSVVVWRYYALKVGKAVEGYTGVYEQQWLDVLVDDETGKILTVSFEHDNVGYSEDGILEQNRTRVEPLIDFYFSQTGLTEKAELAEASMGKLYEYLETDMGVTEVRYTVTDPACGTIKITFAVSGPDAFQIAVTQ